MIAASSSSDVNKLAMALENLSLADKELIEAITCYHGLMRPPFLIGLFLKYIGWSKGIPGLRTFFRVLNKREPEAAQFSRFHQTIDHIRYGNDTEDKFSVGGFSQREIDLLMSEFKKYTNRDLVV